MNKFILILLMFSFSADLSNAQIMNNGTNVKKSGGNTPVRKILMEEFTGDWCGCCPRGHLMLDTILNEYQDIIPVLIHGGSADEPMATQFGNQLSLDLNVWYPSATFDRYRFDGEETTIFSDSEWREKVADRLDDPAIAEVTLEKSFDAASSQLDITVRVLFKNGAKGDFRYNVYIVEDKVVYDQANNYNEDPHYPALLGRGDPIPGYTHNHVLRKMLAGPYGINPEGEGHIPQNVGAGESYSHSFSVNANSSFKLSDIHLVAYVMSYDGLLGSEVLNAVSVPLLETGINNVGHDDVLNVFPNPSTGLFNISYETENAEKVVIAVRNIQGQTVHQQKWIKAPGKQSLTITPGKLRAGIYFLELSDGETVRYRKVVFR